MGVLVIGRMVDCVKTIDWYDWTACHWSDAATLRRCSHYVKHYRVAAQSRVTWTWSSLARQRPSRPWRTAAVATCSQIHRHRLLSYIAHAVISLQRGPHTKPRTPRSSWGTCLISWRMATVSWVIRAACRHRGLVLLWTSHWQQRKLRRSMVDILILYSLKPTKVCRPALVFLAVFSRYVHPLFKLFDLVCGAVFSQKMWMGIFRHRLASV